jgi:hypothetical protein
MEAATLAVHHAPAEISLACWMQVFTSRSGRWLLAFQPGPSVITSAIRGANFMEAMILGLTGGPLSGAS